MNPRMLSSIIITLMLMNCSQQSDNNKTAQKETDRKYSLERVEPARVVQLYADGFEQLTPKQRVFLYYLSQAALAGRDIAIDQHHPNALEVRELFEQVFARSEGIDPAVTQKLSDYLKLFWINNGFYDNLTSKKFVPELSFDEFKSAIATAQKNGAQIGSNGETIDAKLERLRKIVFDPAFEPVMTNKTPGEEWIQGSAVNFYGKGITYKEVEQWAKAGSERYALNSKVVKENGKLTEKVWRAGGDGIAPGLYASDLNAVIKYLEMAIPYAESDYQAETIRLLIKHFRTGELEDFRKYNIHWVKDSSKIDFIMGFIEVYLDPRGQKAEWEASIYFNDPVQTKMMEGLARYAQDFENRMPWADAYKKQIDRSPIAAVINVTAGVGGAGPVSPIGINLPNEQAIREDHGSKSVLLHNIIEANNKAAGSDILKEFAYDEEEIENEQKYGIVADNLHTAMHEVIGHGSGKASPKLGGKDPSDFLPGYYNTLEEARADLVALWHAWDGHLIDIGLAKDQAEARKIGETMYDQAIRVGITQLRRIGKSDQLEEDHLKNRQLIAHYIMQNSEAVKVESKSGKTYYTIVDYDKMRESVGKLLTEVMRIKAEGDLPAAKKLIDTYGLKVDTKLRDEVQDRAAKLNAAAYTGFVFPELEPVMDPEAKVVDVKVNYPLDLARQMLGFSQFTKNEKAAIQTSVAAK